MSKKKYTKEILINEIKRYVKQFGVLPNSVDIDNVIGFPNSTTFRKNFNSWKNVILEAGYSLTEYNRIHKSRSNKKNQIIQLKRHGKDNINVKSYEEYCMLCIFYIDKSDYEKIKGYDLYLKGIEVHKDHMISKNDGFLQGIHPYLIAHPANCQFLYYKDNLSKLSKSSLTFDELKNRIIEWELKNDGDIDYFKKLFECKLDIERIEIPKLSKITGQFYFSSSLLSGDWNHPNKIKTAKILAKSFGFELGKIDTLQNLIDAVNQIRYSYNILKLSSTQIKDKFKINHNNMPIFLKNNIGITLRTSREENELIKQRKRMV
jgi:hypothetical protein